MSKYTDEEKAYVCRFYEYDGTEKIALALNKTVLQIRNLVKYLKRVNKFEEYKNKWGETIE